MYILTWSIAVYSKAYHWYLATRRWPQRAKDTNCNSENRMRIAITKINNFMQWTKIKFSWHLNWWICVSVICIETAITFDKVILWNHLPYTNNLPKIIFKGTNHVLVKIKLLVCFTVGLRQRNIPKKRILLWLLYLEPLDNDQLRDYLTINMAQ